jgi:hypothetical protein
MEQAAERRTERLILVSMLAGVGTYAILQDDQRQQDIGRGLLYASAATLITFEIVIVTKDRKAARALLRKSHP